MSLQSQTELLSAYLDGELPPEEHIQVEKMLAEDASLRATFEGLRRVATGIRLIERQPPPPGLDLVQLRRLARMDRHRGIFDGFEEYLAGRGRQMSLLPVCALLLAIGMAIYSYSVWNRQNPVGDSAQISGRMFLREGDVWYQEGVNPLSLPHAVSLDSGEGRRLLASRPELKDVSQLGEVVLETDDGLVRLLPPDRLPSS